MSLMVIYDMPNKKIINIVQKEIILNEDYTNFLVNILIEKLKINLGIGKVDEVKSDFGNWLIINNTQFNYLICLLNENNKYSNDHLNKFLTEINNNYATKFVEELKHTYIKESKNFPLIEKNLKLYITNNLIKTKQKNSNKNKQIIYLVIFLFIFFIFFIIFFFYHKIFIKKI